MSYVRSGSLAYAFVSSNFGSITEEASPVAWLIVNWVESGNVFGKVFDLLERFLMQGLYSNSFWKTRSDSRALAVAWGGTNCA